MDTDPRQYEIASLISPEASEEEVFSIAGKITNFLQDAGAIVGKIEEPKKIKLAYPIKKFREAYFGWVKFTLLPEKLAGIEKKIKLEKAIIRYLAVIAEEEPVRLRTFHPHRIQESGRGPSSVTPPEEKLNVEELDRRLEEILGKNNP